MLMLTLFLQVTGAGWFVVDVAVGGFKFRLVAVNIAVERASFFSSVGAVPGRYEAASQWVIGMRSLIPK